MAAKTKFEVYKDNKAQFRWRLLAANGEPVASSGEGFPEKRTAMNAVKKLKDWSNTDVVVDIEKMKEEAKNSKTLITKIALCSSNFLEKRVFKINIHSLKVFLLAFSVWILLFFLCSLV